MGNYIENDLVQKHLTPWIGTDGRKVETCHISLDTYLQKKTLLVATQFTVQCLGMVQIM